VCALGEAGGLTQEMNAFGRAPPVQIALLSACAQHGCPIRDILGMLPDDRNVIDGI
jgi:hypothetical protein